MRVLLAELLPLGLDQLHLSAGVWVDSVEEFRKAGMGMGALGNNEWAVWRTSEEVVREVRQIVDDAWAKRGHSVHHPKA